MRNNPEQMDDGVKAPLRGRSKILKTRSLGKRKREWTSARFVSAFMCPYPFLGGGRVGVQMTSLRCTGCIIMSQLLTAVGGTAVCVCSTSDTILSQIKNKQLWARLCFPKSDDSVLSLKDFWRSKNDRVERAHYSALLQLFVGELRVNSSSANARSRHDGAFHSSRLACLHHTQPLFSGQKTYLGFLSSSLCDFPWCTFPFTQSCTRVQCQGSKRSRKYKK